jgi:RNA-directed DNA polymerase
MPKDAPVDAGAPQTVVPQGSWSRVSGMQAKLHRWAAADAGRRFDDLFNFVCDPATLIVAFDRVAGNTGANTPGVDGVTVADVEASIGAPGFLNDLRDQLRGGRFRPLPVRERKIPKPGGSGKLRRLGIPTIADRVVQAALKLVLEPIFEADFVPVSYGFRPRRRAHDAIAEIQRFGTKGYRWVLDADIEACFDSISHPALMDRVRIRVKDKRVLALVKAFLKAGVLTELGDHKDSPTGTPQGGILSPLLANIALSALDEHVHGPWWPGGVMSSPRRRAWRRHKNLPTGGSSATQIYVEFRISRLMPSSGLCRPWWWTCWSAGLTRSGSRHSSVAVAGVRGGRGTRAGCRVPGSGRGWCRGVGSGRGLVL